MIINESSKPLSKMTANELRDIAVALGADRKKLYGTSKDALIVIVNDLKKKHTPSFDEFFKNFIKDSGEDEWNMSLERSNALKSEARKIYDTYIK